MSSTYTDRKNLAYDAQQSVPSLARSPIQVPIELSRIAFPITVMLKDDRTDFVQEEQLVLQCWTMIWATCVLVDVSRCLDILTWEVAAMLERPPLLTWVLADTASAACLAQPGSLEMISMTVAAVI